MNQETYQNRIKKARENKQKSYEKHLARQQDSPVYKLRQYLNEIRISNRSGSHVNCFRYFPNNTDKHEDMKYAVFKYLRKIGHDVIVEAIFENTARADIVDLTNGMIYEIIYSETKEECKEKVRFYPDIFEVRIIDAKQPFKEEDILA